ncbi:leukocyte elastase inhibitor-like [Engraulis encrasicolus]|uniref:leukocyte elastase inhibitor-like n=1 Tax=Engraulis encrasicolus TaxID=184585 RepID=UPI002FD0A7D6
MELSQANGEFALDVFRALCQDSEGPLPSSLVFSPLSISTALAMVYLGARNKTQEEMEKVLRFAQVSDVHSHFNALTKKITPPASSLCTRKLASRLSGLSFCTRKQSNRPSAPRTYTLNLANRLFGEQTFNFSQEFLGEVQKKYLADLQAMDFVSATEAARGTINTWVENNTNNKIMEPLKAGVLTSMTRLVLVNTVYFKGNWMHRFKPENTKEKPFKITKTESRPVQMMYRKVPVLHDRVEENDMVMQVVELPYTDPQLSMVILLPPEGTLDTVMSKLTISKLLEWTDPSKLQRENVHVYLPRFKMESSFSLKDTLTALGMGSLFDCDDADLTGISGDGGLFLSAVEHNAWCEVNEEGTEAAAATSDRNMERCLKPPDPLFMAEHPFLFLIMHKPTRSILFLGRYCGPQ